MTTVMRDRDRTQRTLRIPFLIVDSSTELFGQDRGILLGMPWLEQVNPDVDWVEKSWRFRIERGQIAFMQGRKQIRQAMRDYKQVGIARIADIQSRRNHEQEDQSLQARNLPEKYQSLATTPLTPYLDTMG